MKILGISAYYHDSAAAIICDGKIIAAAQEERFSRIKHDARFPVNAIKFCLTYSGTSLAELDAVAFYDKPLLKFERLLETYYANAPKGLLSFISSMPIWIKEKLFLKRILRQELRKIEKNKKLKIKLLFPEHHLSHAASAFYPSSFEEAAILTIDGVGEWTTASICYGSMNTIQMYKELKFPHSLGLLYSAFTYFLGFKVNSGEYKLMGLSPYGAAVSERTKKYIGIIKEKLVDINEDGSIFLHMDYFNFETGLTMVYHKKWEELFGMVKRNPESGIGQDHCDLAFAIQNVTDEIVIKMAAEAKKITTAKNICVAGGVALNCVSNGKLLRLGLFENIFIQPAAGDAGGAIGTALAAYYIYFGKERIISNGQDGMQGAFLGPEYSNAEIELIVKKLKANFKKIESFDELTDITADILSEGNVVGWFQGRMEFGPRALGNRSILADARNSEMQKKLNLKIKFRESFRPFAPSVLFENQYEYFNLLPISQYMLMVAKVKVNKQVKLPVNYNELSLSEKLHLIKSEIPAVTHVDFTSRIQTVHKETNPTYWMLLNKFKEKTDCSIIVNTSFNIRSEPIVCSPEDAYICFMRTGMDFLVMGNYIFDKKLQPVWKETKNWKDKFKLD